MSDIYTNDYLQSIQEVTEEDTYNSAWYAQGIITMYIICHYNMFLDIYINHVEVNNLK